MNQQMESFSSTAVIAGTSQLRRYVHKWQSFPRMCSCSEEQSVKILLTGNLVQKRMRLLMQPGKQMHGISYSLSLKNLIPLLVSVEYNSLAGSVNELQLPVQFSRIQKY